MITGILAEVTIAKLGEGHFLGGEHTVNVMQRDFSGRVSCLTVSSLTRGRGSAFRLQPGCLAMCYPCSDPRMISGVGSLANNKL